MTTQNLWDAAKAVLRRKFIVIQSYLKKQQQQKTLNRKPNFAPKTTGKRRTKKKTPKISRKKEIIKIRAEIIKKKERTIVKINKTKSWFFEKINQIDKPLARLIKKKENNQINKIRNETGEVTTDSADIQRIREYYEQV